MAGRKIKIKIQADFRSARRVQFRLAGFDCSLQKRPVAFDLLAGSPRGVTGPQFVFQPGEYELLRKLGRSRKAKRVAAAETEQHRVSLHFRFQKRLSGSV